MPRKCLLYGGKNYIDFSVNFGIMSMILNLTMSHLPVVLGVNVKSAKVD